MAYWLLSTHLFALFPMGIFLWSWKRRKDPASIFLLIKFLYLVTFSLLYHQHNDLGHNAITTDNDHEKWSLLDAYASSSLIFTSVLYGLRVRPPQFYIASFAVENVVLIINLWSDLAHLLNAWYLFLCSLVVCVLKWKTIWRYFLKFKCLSFLTVSSGITAMIMFLIASNEWDVSGGTYIKFHSLWHCFIFATAGFVSLLRYNLDEELYPMINRREQLNSI